MTFIVLPQPNDLMLSWVQNLVCYQRADSLAQDIENLETNWATTAQVKGNRRRRIEGIRIIDAQFRRLRQGGSA